MEVKNGIIIDGVLHEAANYPNDYDCIICSLHKECDEFERKYKIHLCNIMKCFRFANRSKVTDIKTEKEE